MRNMCTCILFRLYRLCSNYEECQHDTSRPMRLLDIMLYYEDHCKDVKLFTQTKYYVAQIIPRIFPSVKSATIYRNGKQYRGFSGLKQVNVASVILSESANPTIHHDRRGNIEIALPSLYKRNENQLYVVTTLSEGEIDMGLSDGTTFERFDGKDVDIPPSSTVTRPVKALVQLSKSIRICRGIETCEETAERWTSIISKDVQLRERTRGCKNVVPWLSKVGLCSACNKCRILIKKRKLQEDAKGESVATDVDLLNAIIELVCSEDGSETTALALLQSQLDNTDPKKNPRCRKWSREIITLCLTLFCRYVLEGSYGQSILYGT